MEGKTLYRILITAALAFLAGCGAGEKDFSKSLCPPPANKAAVIEKMRSRQADITEFAAKGSAIVNLLAEQRTESLNNVTAYFSDEDNVIIKVGHTFGMAMLLGANDEEFWCAIDFSDINEFYYGSKSRLSQCGAQGIKTFPVSEAFGIVDIDMLADAPMFFHENEYGFEIYDRAGEPVKTYTFDNCTALLKQITYYENGVVAVVADFSRYRPLNDTVELPSKTTIFSTRERMELEFDTSRFIPISLSDSKRGKLYSRPSPPSNANVYVFNSDCEFEKQQ
jgi:hypothetical protein